MLRAVRQVTVSVCKEQSPSAREDGWEPVQQLELGPGRQHESLSLDVEARFVKFHIGAGCAPPLNGRWGARLRLRSCAKNVLTRPMPCGSCARHG